MVIQQLPLEQKWRTFLKILLGHALRNASWLCRKLLEILWVAQVSMRPSQSSPSAFCERAPLSEALLICARARVIRPMKRIKNFSLVSCQHGKQVKNTLPWSFNSKSIWKMDNWNTFSFPFGALGLNSGANFRDGVLRVYTSRKMDGFQLPGSTGPSSKPSRFCQSVSLDIKKLNAFELPYVPETLKKKFWMDGGKWWWLQPFSM